MKRPPDGPAQGLKNLLGDRVVAAWVAAGLLLHLVLALGFHLSPDEAHYAMYAAHPDWSYYDHPPLVGVDWEEGRRPEVPDDPLVVAEAVDACPVPGMLQG